ncbi:MAG: hypothetical protein MK125_01295 [Dehalococcoidia bacterium]|nr:hypothetical protein [Dehalococcoidia bacterium]
MARNKSPNLDRPIHPSVFNRLTLGVLEIPLTLVGVYVLLNPVLRLPNIESNLVFMVETLKLRTIG